MSAPVFLVGLNPYGLTYTLGLQGAGTSRANPQGSGLDGFLTIAGEIGARCVEMDSRWFSTMNDDGIARVADRVAQRGATAVYSCGLSQTPSDTLVDHIRIAHALGAKMIRMHLTPVLEGARARWGAEWPRFVAHARTTLVRDAPRAADAGLSLAIEDHQDFGSEELLGLAEAAGDAVGIVFDTGNPFAVAEDPLAFLQRALPRVRHVHLKDYVAQFTREGYRLVRCAIGDGAVPFEKIGALLKARESGTSLTASIEPGALEARHIRLFARDWWTGYPPRAADELVTALDRLRRREVDASEDVRTPWERGRPGAEIADYEIGQIHRSMANVRRWGWTQESREQ